MIAQGRKAQPKSILSKPNPMLFELNCGKNSKMNVKLDFSEICQQYQYQQGVPQQKIRPSGLLPQSTYSNRPQLRVLGSASEKEHIVFENQIILQRLEDQNTLENSIQNNIMRPKPMSTYCQVCHLYFDDYLQHTQHQSHKRRVGQYSKSSKFIDDLIDDLKFQSKRPRSQKLLRFKDEDQLNKIQTSSSKIRVISSQNTLTPIRLYNTKNSQISVNQTSSQKQEGCKQNTEQNFSNSLLLLQ